MSFLIYFVLISSLSVSAIDGPVDRMKNEIQKFLEKGGSITGSSDKNLHLMQGEKLLGETKHSLVYKGKYSDITKKNVVVAVKITMDKACYDREITIYDALNATSDPTIEQHGIPRIYYHGTFLRRYYVIAMTLFDGTLEDLYNKNGNITSDYSILLILKQAVQILQYLHTVDDLIILHNDIKPGNIFFRGLKVFIADFDFATIDMDQTFGNTPIFASSNYYSEVDRYPMDDLESLVYSIWFVTGVDMVRTLENYAESEGEKTSKCRSKYEIKNRFMEKCRHYKGYVEKAFEFICCEEIASGRRFIRYDEIIKELDDAMRQVKGSKAVHWLADNSSNRSRGA